MPIRSQVERFVGACLEKGDGARATGGDIIKTYVGWCSREGEQPYRPNEVMPALKAVAGVRLELLRPISPPGERDAGSLFPDNQMISKSRHWADANLWWHP